MKILFYDVETANAKNIGSICAVGWELYSDDERIDGGYSLIDPQGRFSKNNTEIHGITAEMVKGAPTFAEYWETVLKRKMEKAVVIAHSAGFDMSATEQALFSGNEIDPGIFYIDSLEVLKNSVDLPSYKLAELAKMAGYEYMQHRADEDVKALVFVLQYYKEQLGFEDFAEFFIKSRATVLNTLDNAYTPKEIISEMFQEKSHCREKVEGIDRKLNGMRFCISGDIPGRDRSDVERIIMQHGGRATSCVSGQTDYLVVGDFTEFGENFISGKQKKAVQIIEQGGKIKIISPEELFIMMGEIL